MNEILTPIEPQENTDYRVDIKGDSVDENLNTRNIEFLSALDLKYGIGNDEIMEKINYLTERISTEELDEIKIRVGVDLPEERLKKVYLYVQLQEQAKDLRSKLSGVEQNLWHLRQKE